MTSIPTIATEIIGYRLQLQRETPETDRERFLFAQIDRAFLSLLDRCAEMKVLAAGVQLYAHCIDESGQERFHQDSQCRVCQWMNDGAGPSYYVLLSDYQSLAAVPQPDGDAA